MCISDWMSDVCSSDLAASLFGAVVTLSMASTPLLMTLVRRFNREDAPITAALDGPEIAGAARAIVIGYGRVGQTVAQMIMAQGASVTVIDSNPEQIERTASFGMKVYYGDGSRVDLLRREGPGIGREWGGERGGRA